MINKKQYKDYKEVVDGLEVIKADLIFSNYPCVNQLQEIIDAYTSDIKEYETQEINSKLSIFIPGTLIVFTESDGFCYWSTHYLLVDKIDEDGRYWYSELEVLSGEMGYKLEFTESYPHEVDNVLKISDPLRVATDEDKENYDKHLNYLKNGFRTA